MNLTGEGFEDNTHR